MTVICRKRGNIQIKNIWNNTGSSSVFNWYSSILENKTFQIQVNYFIKEISKENINVFKDMCQFYRDKRFEDKGKN